MDMGSCYIDEKKVGVTVGCSASKLSLEFSSEVYQRTYKIEARNLSYSIAEPSKSWFWSRGEESSSSSSSSSSRSILNNVNCKAKPWEILAIAGPSGAGKSTLLQLLAGRTKPPTSESESIFINDIPADAKQLRRISGYVTQNDALFPFLTVEETLMFSARLRLCSKEADKRSRVAALIKDLGLSHVRGSRIGNERVRGISGGERRRVSIGVDVVHDPPVLILDEPTSGLDSSSALHIIKILKSMAELHGRTVILSIHQPGFRILELFDSILLLSHGSAIHHGSLQALHSNILSAGYRILPHVNILEYAMDAIGSLQWDKEQQHQGRVKVTLYDLFRIVNLTEAGALNVYDPPRFATSRGHEIVALSHRFFLNVVRSKQLFVARSVQAAGAGLCLGSIFYRCESAEERLGLFAFSLTFLMSSASEGLPIFVQEREILMRETYGGAYRVSSYVSANALVFLPFMLIMALLFSLPVYFLAGLNGSASAFFYFVLVIWLAIYGANSLVAVLSAVVPNYIMGTTLITGLLGAFFLFSGFFLSKSDMPKYWMFMHYLSLFKYPLEALLINEYSQADKCLGYVWGKCVMDVKGVMKDQGLQQSNKWSNLVVLLGFISLYRFLSFLALRFRCSHRTLF
ncbi:hypothetical protein SUGI_0930160 [Cryptomeria japonica]|nr:hypothetical protein SUGI_0930160 [Cryptomeria japonica]